MSTENLNFIVVDDSKLDCFIAEKIIKNTGRVNNCNVFQQASDALAFINNQSPDATTKSIVFVDIQMPVMNGFEFVEAFEAFPEEKIKNHNIYMLSSSINENDIAKVKGYSSVKRFLNKPLTNDTISTVLSEI